MEEPRYIVCSQNELLRKTSNESKLNIGTMGLMVCPGVVIKDQRGNISLAHVDAKTDFTFIEEEIEHIKRRNGGAPCQITIYRNTFQGRVPLEHKTEVISLLEKYLEEKKLRFDVQKIDFETLVIHEDGDFTAIDPENVKRFMQGNGEVVFELADKASLQKNTYELQLVSGFSIKTRKPLLVYDEGKFTRARNQPLDDELATYIFQPGSENEKNIRAFYLKRNQKPITVNGLNSLMHVIPRYKQLVLELADKYKLAGNGHYAKNEYASAISCFEEALKLNPRFKEAFHNIGQCYCALKKYETAVTFFDKALAVDPNYQNAKTNKAKALAGLKEQPKLKETLKPK